MTKTWYSCALLAIVIVAAAFRLPALDARPMHTDEAVHAYKFDEFWRTGEYVYDPFEYHGPTLYYFTWPIMWLGGGATYAEANETTFRLGPALFGIGLILLLPLVADGLGRPATVIAGLLIAVSPAMTFFSRYYIQEPLLTFFAFAMIACGWRYVRSKKIVWALLCGASIGLMHASKETSIISWAASAMAIVFLIFLRRKRRGGGRPEQAQLVRETVQYASKKDGKGFLAVAAPIVCATVVAAAVSIMCFSTFFQNWRGPIDSLGTYQTYFHRAGTQGLHLQPWYYFLKIFSYTQYGRGPVWTELFIIALAIVGICSALFSHRRDARAMDLPRFLAVYALIQLVVYSAIPYKTPWCMLQFFHPLCLLAGVGAQRLIRAARWLPLQIWAATAMLAGVAHLTTQSYRLNFDFSFAHRTAQPYIYAHTLNGMKKMAVWVDRLAEVHEDGDDMLVKVIADDAWPTPWYLRHLPNVGYWPALPDDVDAPVIIVAETLYEEFDARRKQEYHVSIYGLRRGVRMLVCAEQSLFEAFQTRERAKATTRETSP
ncbi:MAG: TIGR03663 family protein [Planctomycetes bacterium]|nr:TIGR03663 family protein [Planctomycetota bacterium]